MIAQSHEIHVSTRGNDHILDVTPPLQEIVAAAGISIGQLTVMVVGSTAALTTLEFEPGLVDHDMTALLERLAPKDGVYQHELTWNDDNGHSHLRASLIGPSLAIPIVDGNLPLGTWQQVVLVDCDTRPRERRLAVAVVGAPRTDSGLRVAPHGQGA